jgi:cytochrome c-type biogenesis protein CcmH
MGAPSNATANATSTARTTGPATLSATLPSNIPPPSDPALEARVHAISAELRCLVCQNQTVADSNAGLAVDLRNQVRTMLQRGESEAQVIAFMTARYGDFVLYRPPVRSSTWVLWYGPGLLLVGGLLALVWVLRRRSRLPDDQFDPDPELNEAEPDRYTNR